MSNEWISVKEAAALYGLNDEYFRRNYCDEGGIMDRMNAMRVRIGPTGKKRTIQILRSAIEDLVERERAKAS